MLARCHLDLIDVDTGEILGSSNLERPIEFPDIDLWVINWRNCLKRGFLKGRNLSLNVTYKHYTSPVQKDLF